MTYENFIGLRYLMSKRRSRVLSVITVISVVGVALGVTAMIVVLSVMGGFKKDLKQKILGTKAHVVVKNADGSPMDSPKEVLEAADEVDGIVGASPYIEGEVMASSPSNLKGVVLRGIDLDRFREVSEVPREITKGRYEFLADPEKSKQYEGEEFEGKPGSMLRDIEETQKRIEDAQREQQKARDSIEVVDGNEGDDGSKAPGTPPEEESFEESGGDGEATESDEESPEAQPPPLTGESGSDGDGGADGRDGPMPSVAGDDEEDATVLPGLIIGKELAKSLSLDVGDEVNVVTPKGEIGPTGPIPQSRPFRVVGVFYTGMYEYDASYGYTTLEDAADFIDQSGVTGVELKTESVDKAMASADALDARLDDRYDVLDWKELNESLFYALKLEKIAMFLVLIFIVLVASFSIIAMLIMIVLEKSRDISVMKSMGMPNGGVMRIFMLQGVVIGAVGALIGLVLGLGICWYLIEHGIQLDSEVYYISELPVDINALEVTLVVVCTILISFLATVYPSWKAAQLRPVEGLRYE